MQQPGLVPLLLLLAAAPLLPLLPLLGLASLPTRAVPDLPPQRLDLRLALLLARRRAVALPHAIAYQRLHISGRRVRSELRRHS